MSVKRLILVMFAILLLCVMLGGCTQQKDISGTYISEVHMKDILSDEDSQDFIDSGMEFYTNLSIRFSFVLNSDKTFHFTVDTEDFKNSVNVGIEENVGKLLEKQFSENGILPEQYDLVAQNAGYKDYNDLEQNTVQRMKQSLEEEMDWGELEIDLIGNYSIKDGEITFTVTEGDLYIDKGIFQEDDSFVVPTVFAGEKEAVPLEFRRK